MTTLSYARCHACDTHTASRSGYCFPCYRRETAHKGKARLETLIEFNSLGAHTAKSRAEDEREVGEHHCVPGCSRWCDGSGMPGMSGWAYYS